VTVRRIRRLAAPAIALALLLPLPARAAPTFPYPWPDYSVIPVLFAATDWPVTSAEVQAEAAALRTAMAEIRQFYASQLGGRTFRLNDLSVVQALHPKEHYHIIWNGRNIYEDGVEFDGNMEHEVVSELHARGFPTPVAQNESGYSVIIFVKGAGGWAGAREFPQADGGWAILGDWAIDSIEGDVPEGAYWWSGRRIQTGAAAHELGHTFDLPHPDAYGYPFHSTIMGNFWDYPTAGLNDWERRHVMEVKAPFFPATTISKAPTGVGISRADGIPLGTIESGGAGSLRSNDDETLVVRSRNVGGTQIAAWFGTFSSIPNSLQQLKIVYRGRNSVAASQSVELWSYVTTRWVRLDRRTVGSSEAKVELAVPGTLRGYVSGDAGNGSLRVRVRNANATSGFRTSADQLRITYVP
jgi:hypothetical protein